MRAIFSSPPAVIWAVALAQEDTDQLGQVTEHLNNFIFGEDAYPPVDEENQSLLGAFFESFGMS